MSKHHPQDITSGDVPAQDHDPDQAIEGRQVRFCVRIERTLPSGDPLVEGGVAQADTGEGWVQSAQAERTRGDEHGRFVWKAQNDSLRPIPMWWVGAAPAVTTEASRDLRPPRQLEQAGSRVRPAQPGSQARPDPADQRVRVRPVGDPGWNADERFREIDAALSGASPPLPKGYPGVVLVTTQERRQEEVFLPGAGPLVAVDHAGDPALASEVSDLRPDDSLDPDRRARLHTMMRVVRLRAGVGFPTANALAWQLKLASQDGYAGGGAVIDAGSVFSGEGETRADEPPGGGVKAGTAPSVEAQYGAVTNLGNYTPPPPHDGQYGGVTHLGGTSTRPPGGGGTQTRPPGGDPTRTRPPNSPPTAASGNVIGMCSSKLSGPIDVGRPDDVHRLGTTEDGEPINSGHVPCSVPFIGPGGDASLDFEHGVPYSNPPSWPFRAPVHLRYDPGATHEHVTGPKPGRWRWEAEVPIYLPDPEPPPDPPPHLPPGGMKLWIPDYTKVQPGGTVGVIPDWMQELADELGVRPGSIGASGTIDISPEEYEELRRQGKIDEHGNLVGSAVNRAEENRAPRYPTMLHTLRLGGGLLMRAYAMGEGEKSTTGAAGSMAVDEETRRQADKAPDVMLLVPYAPGDGTAQGFTGVVVSPNGQRVPTTGGGAMPLPASADPRAVMAGTGTKPAVPVQVAIPPGYTQIAYGTPNPETGLVGDGATTEGVDETENIDGIDFPKTGIKIAVQQGGEHKGTLSLTQVGSTMTLEVAGEGATKTEVKADKVSCDVLDPYAVVFDPWVFPFAPLEFSSIAPGLFTWNDTQDPDDGAPFDPYWFDGLDARRLAYADELPSGSTGEVIPVGAIMQWHSATPPPGFLLCNGQTVSRTTYADLFAVIGETFGAGDGATTFNLPNLTDRSPMGAGGSLVPNAGDTAGAATHTLTVDEIPAHNHGFRGGNSTVFGSEISAVLRSLNHTVDLTTNPAGGGQAHNNLHPVLGLFFVIAYQSFGLKGPQGDPGPQGPEGPQGPQGEPGLDYTDNVMLNALSALTPAADRLPYTTDGTTAALATLTAAGRALLDDADAAAQRTTLGLGTIATQDADDVAITGGSVTGITDLAVEDGGTGASTAADARANLGVPPTTRAIHTTAPLTGGGDLSADRTIALAAQAANTVLAGPTTGADAAPTARALVADDIPDLAASKITSGTLDAARLPTIAETKGGTNQTTYAAGDLLYASAANTLSRLARGTDGQVLTLASGLPSWAAPAGGGKLTLISATTINTSVNSVTLSGLAGDSARHLLVVFTIRNGGNSTLTCYLQPNGLTTNLQGVRGSSTGSFWDIGQAAATSSHGCLAGHLWIDPTRQSISGQERYPHFHGTTAQYQGNAASVNPPQLVQGIWAQNLTQLTSLVFAPNVTNGIGAGSHFSVYRLEVA